MQDVTISDTFAVLHQAVTSSVAAVRAAATKRLKYATITLTHAFAKLIHMYWLAYWHS